MSNLTLLAHLHLIFRTFSNQYKPNPIKNNPISCNPICSSGSATPAAASINNWKLFRMISHVFSAISLVLTSRGFVPVASSRRYYFFIVSFFFFYIFVSAFLRAKSDGNRRHFFFVSCTEIDKEGAGGGGGGGGAFPLAESAIGSYGNSLKNGQLFLLSLHSLWFIVATARRSGASMRHPIAIDDVAMNHQLLKQLGKTR